MPKILIADDSTFMRRMMVDILKEGGYDFVEAANGKEALGAVKTEKPDLLILDIIMPELDGIGVLEKLDNKKLPVLVVSAIGQGEMVEKAKKLGAVGYIIKPFEEEIVLEEVKKALGS